MFNPSRRSEMLRKGVGSSVPFFTIFILPPCSKTKRRCVPSFGAAIPTGEVKPLEMRWSLMWRGGRDSSGVVNERRIRESERKRESEGESFILKMFSRRFADYFL